MSVVFDFNESLNDVAPASLMSLSVHVNRIGKRVNCCWISFVCCLSLPSQLR